ncbi:MAG TPA: CvpA family protein [Candidatus Nitrosotenuis sp.]|jgi:uncharacterized membrane protein required for colicin V production|nr:CvpA family protein [Candidatus Nitrosotenuis sp.]
MTWVDAFLVVLILLLMYGGYKRGTIGELFDVLAIAGGAFFTVPIFGTVALWLQDIFDMSNQGARWLAFFLLFVPSWSVIMRLGLHLDQVSREGPNRLAAGVDSALGTLLGLLKGLVLAWLFLVALNYILPAESPTRKNLRDAPVVQSVQSGIGPTVVSTIEFLTPPKTREWLIPALERQF